MWSLFGLLIIIQNILPTQILVRLNSIYQSIQDFFTPHTYFDIPEFNGSVDHNDLYRHVSIYLTSLNSTASCRRVSLFRSESSDRISLSAASHHSIHDCFRGLRLSWTHQDSLDERRGFTLKFPTRHCGKLLNPYLNHVTARADELESVASNRQLYTNNGGSYYGSGWSSVPFRHPSTFETLALEPDLKKKLMDDLTAFSGGKDFYKKIGRAWRRGYLLYGPPGAGKSSLIAAMANFLRYDVYDLELSKVENNSELRALLMQTTNRSIIVIEDIDCSVDLRIESGGRSLERRRAGDNREENGQVSLSGLLDFTDGLWSWCGEERVIVFTANDKETVDPALTRRGRMDMHIGLGTCGMHGFRTLVRNYLGLETHALFDEVERYLMSGGALMPAQIAEILLKNRREADVAVNAVASAMQEKIVGAYVDGGMECGDVASGMPEDWEGSDDGN